METTIATANIDAQGLASPIAARLAFAHQRTRRCDLANDAAW
jgi:hypothetical protein